MKVFIQRKIVFGETILSARAQHTHTHLTHSLIHTHTHTHTLSDTHTDARGGGTH